MKEITFDGVDFTIKDHSDGVGIAPSFINIEIRAWNADVTLTLHKEEVTKLAIFLLKLV
jgi:hypothetical protein